MNNNETDVNTNEAYYLNNDIYSSFAITRELQMGKLVFPTDFEQEEDVAFEQFELTSSGNQMEFSLLNNNQLNIVNVPPSAAPTQALVAQFLVWKWDAAGGNQTLIEHINLGAGDEESIQISGCNVQIRMLKRMPSNISNCAPIGANDVLHCVVGEELQFCVSFHYMRMISVRIREHFANDATLETAHPSFDLRQFSPDEFRKFLQAISPECIDNLPTPLNVISLLKLAHFLGVSWLKDRCDSHLIGCVEKPLIKRFLLIERFGLVRLKKFVLVHMADNNFREFFNLAQAEYGQGNISEALYGELTSRLGAIQ
uniref:BTB domain-containing protein n=1 Tax=Globodera rostochiensis TaxID=31243 RepID=A0A914HF15_GLORO